MKRTMNLLTRILITGAFVMSMTSCNKENSEENTADIVGTWQFTKYSKGKKVLNILAILLSNS